MTPSSHSSVAVPADPKSMETTDTGAQVTVTHSMPITCSTRTVLPEVHADSQNPDNHGKCGDVLEVSKLSCTRSLSVSDSGSQKPGQCCWAKYRSEHRGGSDSRRIVLCTVCIMYPDIVKLRSRRTPAICTTSEAVFRQQLVDEHAARVILSRRLC